MQHIAKVIDQLRGKLARQIAAVEDTRQHIQALTTLKLEPEQKNK